MRSESWTLTSDFLQQIQPKLQVCAPMAAHEAGIEAMGASLTRSQRAPVNLEHKVFLGLKKKKKLLIKNKF